MSNFEIFWTFMCPVLIPIALFFAVVVGRSLHQRPKFHKRLDERDAAQRAKMAEWANEYVNANQGPVMEKPRSAEKTVRVELVDRAAVLRERCYQAARAADWC